MGEKFGGWFDADEVAKKHSDPVVTDKLQIKDVLEKTLGGIARLKDGSEDWPEGNVFVGVGLQGLKVLVEPDGESSGKNLAIPLCKLQLLCAHGIEEFIAPPSVIKEMINTLTMLLAQLMASDSDFMDGMCDVEVSRIDSGLADDVVEKLKEMGDILRKHMEEDEEEDDDE